MVGRHPKTNESIEVLKIVLKEHVSQIIQDGKLVSRSHDIWHTISGKLEYVYTPGALYTMVAKNYYDIHSVVGLLKASDNGDPSKISDNNDYFNRMLEFTNYSISNDINEDSTSSSSISSSEEAQMFSIILSRDEYNEIFPHDVIYRDRTSDCVNSQRNYVVLQQRCWTQILYKKIDPILKALHNDCYFAFRRNKIYPNGLIYARLWAQCRECKSTLVCTLDNIPEDMSREIVITAKIFKGDLNKGHCLKKRPLVGERRRNISNILVSTNMAPSHLRRRMALTRDDVNSLPSLGTLKQAKHELVKTQRPDNDPIMAIWKMKLEVNMEGAIQQIGLDPFFVYIWSNTQMHVYNSFCSSEYGKVCIDATGSVVKKIIKPSGEKSSHIFLYDLVIRSNNSKVENQYSVASMLSESQNAVSIYSWLAHFIRSGAAIPRECVTDMSLALIYACVLAFTKFKTLLNYINHCFDVIFNKSVLIEKCFIRTDVAHFVKLLTQWKSLKSQHRLTRQFYLRAIGQVVQSSDIEDIGAILRAIFTVAISDTEGHNTEGKANQCEILKQWLKRRCATGSVEDIINENIDNFSKESAHDYDGLDFDKNEENSFYLWALDIYRNCLEIVNKDAEIGDRGNQQCVPDLCKDLLKICKNIPLWSAVMKPYFPLSPLIASSASVESNFNNTKHRTFGNMDLPLRLDDFLKVFIESNEGAARLATNYNKKLGKKNIDLTSSCNDQHSEEMIKDRTDIILSTENSDVSLQCPSCQLRLPGSQTCQNCLKFVHKNNLCYVEIDQIILCKNCSCMEQTALENWRGQTTQVKKRPRNSYLEPATELLEGNYDAPRKVLPIGLLKNGNSLHLKPIKISKNISVVLTNTCGFDALIQLMSSAYCDSFAFKFLIDLIKNESEVAALIVGLVKSGVSKQVYRMRAEILRKIFPVDQQPCGIYRINVECVVSNLLSKLDLNKCFLEELFCNMCDFKITRFKQSIEVEISDAVNLNTAIVNNLYKLVSDRECKTNNCKGNLYFKSNVALTHFFVEPLNTVTKICELECTLNDLPKIIKFNDITYVLRGVVGYVGPNLGLGHFIAYSYRHNNLWSEYDDRNSKENPCSSQKIVRTQILFYSS